MSGGKLKSEADYVAQLGVYEAIGKQRPLTDHELDRVTAIAKLMKANPHHRKYRADHREELRKKDKEYRETPRGRKLANERCKAYYYNNLERQRQKARDWVKNNPEKHQAILQRKKDARAEARRHKEEASNAESNNTASKPSKTA